MTITNTEPTDEELLEIWVHGHLPTYQELVNDDGEQDLLFLFTSAYYRSLDDDPEARAQHEAKCLRAVFNAGRAWGRPAAPPADSESAELAAELRHFVAGYQQMRGLDPEHVYSIHRGDAMEAHLRISRLSRIAELLERPAPLPAPEPAAPVPEPGEVAELVADLQCAAASYFNRGFSTDARRCRRAATLMEQLSAPAPVVVPVPVPVSERLPGEGDCAQWPDDEDESCEPWCWQFTFNEDGWEVMQASKSRLTSPLLKPGGLSHWLPAHAIPLPQTGEVE